MSSRWPGWLPVLVVGGEFAQEGIKADLYFYLGWDMGRAGYRHCKLRSLLFVRAWWWFADWEVWLRRPK